MKIVLDENAIMPTRAHSTDAGLDLYSPKEFVVKAHNSATVDTGVHVEIPEGYAGFLKSKSGLNVRWSIQSDGVIDTGYTGSIVVKLYNHANVPYVFKKGDKITQLVLMKIGLPELEVVDSLEETERGDKGFGSSGR